ncbi:phosphoglycerate mutase-like protein, partial [Schizopora paradoxa]
MSSSDVIGVVILARHGDREGFYQDPITYTASATQITALGNVQEFQLGQQFRSMYINASSPTYVQGMNTVLFDQTQVQVQADGGGERGVIFDSSISVVQGLWPATSNYNSTLANGTTVAAPLGGYQYVPIASIDPNDDVSLEGFTSCNTFNNATLAFYNSAAFKQVAAENAAFLNSLPPFLDGRPVSLENMIFDYMNVQSIHNETFAKALPDGFLERVRALANFHEYGVFSSPQVDGIGNIAGRTMLPNIITGFQAIANASNPLKFVYEAISYKPFISLFNMT